MRWITKSDTELGEGIPPENDTEWESNGMTELETELVSVESAVLSTHPDNARRGNVDAIRESIRTNGFYGAIIAQRSTGHIIVGNHRYMAAMQEGITEIPVIWRDCTDDEARKLLLVDNRSSDAGSYDEESLRDLLALTLDSTGDLLGTGYEQDDLEALMFSLEISSTDFGELLPDALTPDEAADSYQAAGIRSIILPYDLDDYNVIVQMFESARSSFGVESNAEVVRILLAGYTDANS
jgi:hypothetical protein